MTEAMNNTVAPDPKIMFSDSVYAKLKFWALVVLPAISTLYFTLGSVWGLPYVTQVIGTIAAVDTFLGVILGLSTKAYNNSDARYGGSINIVSQDNGVKLYSLELNSDPNDLDGKSEVTFKVGNNPPPVSE